MSNTPKHIEGKEEHIMPICDACGKRFDSEEAENDFEIRFSNLRYSNLRRCLCGDCAQEVIDSLDDGEYYETCERCGKTFDLITEKGEFSSHFSVASGTDLTDHWDDYGIWCADCVIQKLEEDYEDNNDDEDEDDD